MQEAINVGIVGLDGGHAPSFAGYVNGEPPKLPGLRVAAAAVGGVPDDGRLEANTARMRALGIEVVATAEEMAGRVDGILVLANDASVHERLVREYAPLRKPLFVDKPLDVTAARARAAATFCREQGCPLFSASSLRFSLELQAELKHLEAGPVISACTFSPYRLHPAMPGWIYYGIHAVEPLYQIMGPGCREVSCLPDPNGPLARGTWNDGRTGLARAVAIGHSNSYGFTVWREKGAFTACVTPGTIYLELLQTIRAFCRTGTPPVDPEESVEVIAFLEAANRSMERNGEPVPVLASGAHGEAAG